MFIRSKAAGKLKPLTKLPNDLQTPRPRELGRITSTDKQEDKE